MSKSKKDSVPSILSSQITKAYAWLRDQRDERIPRLDEQGADRTETCLRSADGVFRAPLTVLVECGESTDEELLEDQEDAENDDAEYNNVAFTADEITPWEHTFAVNHLLEEEHDDEYSRMTDQMVADGIALATDRRCDHGDLDFVPTKGKTDVYPYLIRDWFGNEQVTGKVFVSKVTHSEVPADGDARPRRVVVSWKATTRASNQFMRHKPTPTGRPDHVAPPTI